MEVMDNNNVIFISQKQLKYYLYKCDDAEQEETREVLEK